MGDKRPVARSGKNDGRVDYSTAQPPQPGIGSTPYVPVGEERKCAYLDRVATLPKVFTPDECTQIINTGLNNWEEQMGKIQRDKEGKIEQNFEDDFDYRNTTLYVPPEPDEWLFSKILDSIMNFNNHETGYQFGIKGLAEPPNLMRYQSEDLDKNGKPGKYDWHMDIGPGAVPSMRKLSYSLLLNPGEYEGGELYFHTGRNIDQPFPGQDQIGTIIVFPSYLVHKVSSITKGTRYTIVGWCHGNSFF